MARSRTILHLDMDAFYASVEILRRPELRGRPVVVGGDGARGVVAAASYEARAYGVFSAMPSVRAKRLCPDAVFLHGDHAHYAAVSARIMAILGEVTPLVEPLSLDEAFCDVTGALGAHGDVTGLAEDLRRRIRQAESLECAVGVGPTKLIAKLASKRAKPRVGAPGTAPRPGPGVVVVEASEQLGFLHGLAVRELWGVGPATVARLEAMGVVTVGDLAGIPVGVLRQRFGQVAGTRMHELSMGVDPRPVEPDRAPRSIGHEETYARDLRSRRELATEVLRLADATARRLTEAGVVARTVQLKVRFADFTTITRSHTWEQPTASTAELARVARSLLDQIDVTGGVRLLGVTGHNLVEASADRQLTLDLAGSRARRNTDEVVDRVRSRFGTDAIAPAALVVDGTVEVGRRGDRRWGREDPDHQNPDRAR